MPRLIVTGALEDQAAFDFNSSRMIRRKVSSNLGALPSMYSRNAALINV